jgi:hypothetical protein
MKQELKKTYQRPKRRGLTSLGPFSLFALPPSHYFACRLVVPSSPAVLLIGPPRRTTSENTPEVSHCAYESCMIVRTSSNTLERTSNNLRSISSDIERSDRLRPRDRTSTRVPMYSTTFFEHYSTSIEQVSNDLLTSNGFIERSICLSWFDRPRPSLRYIPQVTRVFTNDIQAL